MLCDVPNCVVCPVSSVCDACAENFGLKAGKCYERCAGDVYCTESEICQSDTECGRCEHNMYNVAGECRCGSAVCTDTQYCVAGLRECYSCDAEMPNCRKCSDLHTCEEQKAPCADLNCNSCEKSTEECEKCATGFLLRDKGCRQRCSSGTDGVCANSEVCVNEACQRCKADELNIGGLCACGAAGKTCGSTQLCVSSVCAECASYMANCLECTAKDVCSAIKSPCTAQNCAMCESDAAICTHCAEGYELKAAQCEKIPCAMQNCSLCVQNGQKCVQCADNYQPCGDKCCQVCGETACELSQVCVAGAAQACADCKPGELNAGGVCSCVQSGGRCPAQQFCTSTGCTACDAVMFNCRECDDKSECKVQKKPCEDFNCESCNQWPDECVKCTQGFLATNDGCKQHCGLHYCKGSEVCSAGACETCPHNMRNHGGLCVCGVADSDAASSDIVCTQFQYCLPSQQKCESCDKNMGNCAECLDLSTCTVLKQPCSDPNCSMCESTVATCTQCSAGFEKGDNNRCVQTCGPFKCAENQVCQSDGCKFCAANEHNVGASCKCGEHPHCGRGTYCSVAGKCESCPSGCSSCVETVCLTCNSGYSMRSQECVRVLSVGTIIGITVGGTALIFIAAFGLGCFFARMRGKNSAAASQDKAKATGPTVTKVQTEALFI